MGNIRIWIRGLRCSGKEVNSHRLRSKDWKLSYWWMDPFCIGGVLYWHRCLELMKTHFGSLARCGWTRQLQHSLGSPHQQRQLQCLWNALPPVPSVALSLHMCHEELQLIGLSLRCPCLLPGWHSHVHCRGRMLKQCQVLYDDWILTTIVKFGWLESSYWREPRLCKEEVQLHYIEIEYHEALYLPAGRQSRRMSLHAKWAIYVARLTLLNRNRQPLLSPA